MIAGTVLNRRWSWWGEREALCIYNFGLSATLFESRQIRFLLHQVQRLLGSENRCLNKKLGLVFGGEEELMLNQTEGSQKKPTTMLMCSNIRKIRK